MLGGMLRRLLGRARSRAAPPQPPPADPDWLARGFALREAGRNDELADLCARVLARSPDDLDALQLQAAALLARGLSDRGIASLRRAAALAPQELALHLTLARVLAASGDARAAIEVLRHAVTLPGVPVEVWPWLGQMLRALGRYDDAEHYSRMGMAAGAASGALGRILAASLFEQGRVDDALAAIRVAIGLDPADAALHSDLLRLLNYAEGQDPAVVWQEHRAWAQRHARPLELAAPPHDNMKDPTRRLRVGYVSPYFRRHAVSFFLESVLEHHDRDAVEVLLYADVPQPDETSRRLQDHGCVWRSTVGMDDAALAQAVRADATDILVDLSGHTPGHRLLAFARCAAPVQVTWNGYPNTTGMDSMGYRLTDAVCDPPGATEAMHSEALVRLPDVFMTWRTPLDAPPVAPPPAHAAGHITFGSFNGCYKINAAVVRVWARILRVVEGSRLLLLTVDGEVARRRLLDLFSAEGIEPGRLEFLARMSHDEFLRAHARADIALDAFPFHGTTTTCFSLWMGLPVVVLVGSTHASRVGATLLRSVGLGNLAAGSEDDYVAAAAGLAADFDALGALRSGMRDRIAASPLADGRACARAVESAYRSMWHDWCGGRPSEPGAGRLPGRDAALR
jgi:protein O-GlcNAc transferase